MKILHTSDWHIGKIVHGQHMTWDQEIVLKQLIELIDQEEPEAMIIAGDIYDRSIPPVEAVELVDDTLSKIAFERQIPILIISGNHDSAGRLAFGKSLMTNQGVYISTDLITALSPIVLSDHHGKIYFHLIPYIEPILVRHYFQDDQITDHQSAMTRIIEEIKKRTPELGEKGSRHICVTHGYLMGAELPEESVRPLSIGGTELIAADLFEDFDYVALGHLHRPQKVKRDTIRYSGSLLKYSFSEVQQKKSLTMVEIGADGGIDLNIHYLKPIRDMRIIEGPLKTLVSENIVNVANREDYILARLTDEGALLEPMSALRQVYPNVLRMERVTDEKSLINHEGKKDPMLSKRTPMDWLQGFVDYLDEDILDKETVSLCSDVFAEIMKEERER